MSPSWALRGHRHQIDAREPLLECIDVTIIAHEDDPYSRTLFNSDPPTQPPHPLLTDHDDDNNNNTGHGLLHPSTASKLRKQQQQDEDRPLLITLGDDGSSDCVLAVRRSSAIPPNTLALTLTHQVNFHVRDGVQTKICTTDPHPEDDLIDIDLDLTVVYHTAVGGSSGNNNDNSINKTISIDGMGIVQQFLRSYNGHIVAVNESCLFPLPSATAAVVLCPRVVNTLTETEVAEQNILEYHCYRGRITPNTIVHLHPIQRSVPFTVHNPPRPRPPPGQHPCILRVLTNDGEEFPVHRFALRPCIALTKYVRNEEVKSVAVDVDTLTFDRVLMFLQHQARCQGGEEKSANELNFGIHLIPALQHAAEKLGVGSLKTWCEGKIGSSTAKRRWWTFEEIQHRNTNNKECFLIMDGMVFDVTAWLHEHPGGATIIPRQALNIDSSRFFELYHASRESFMYLKEFYVGEVMEYESSGVPKPSVPPSDDFMGQLHEWTRSFRLTTERAFKSF